MKKIVTLILVLTVALVSGCGKTKKDVTSKDNNSENISQNKKEYKVGDFISYGSYEQDGDTANGKEEIRWCIIDIQDGKALLISKYVLDSKMYNEEEESVTWETCTLRTWLNSEFINEAFSSEEQKNICEVNLTNNDNEEYETLGGNDTTDKVFLLDINEAEKYLEEESFRECQPTQYALDNGIYLWADYETCVWWLRSPGEEKSFAADVGYDGEIYPNGNEVNRPYSGIRPSMWIDYDSIYEANKPTSNTVDNCKIGDCISFGNYEQDGDTTNGSEVIEWLVLDINNDSALIVSKYALDSKAYNEDEGNITWEECTLRTWLNDEFLKTAFSNSEQAIIQNTEVINSNNPQYDTNGGNNTSDKVFLLSIEETNKYLDTSYERGCEATQYAIDNGCASISNGNCYWWLRSPGGREYTAACVYERGYIYEIGYDTHNDSRAIRPALWVNIK